MILASSNELRKKPIENKYKFNDLFFQPVYLEQPDGFTCYLDPPPCRVRVIRTHCLNTCHATGSSPLEPDRYDYHCVSVYVWDWSCLSVLLSVHFTLNIFGDWSILIWEVKMRLCLQIVNRYTLLFNGVLELPTQFTDSVFGLLF